MRKKLFVFFMIILTFGVCITGGISYNASKSVIANTSISGLKAESVLVEDILDKNQVNADYDSLSKEIKSKINVRVTFINMKGVVVGESDISKEKLQNHLNRPEIKKAISSGSGYAIRYSDTEKLYMCYYARKIQVDNKDIILRLALKLTDIKEMQDRYSNIIILSIIAGIVISAVFVIIYLQIFTKPIKSFINLATTIAMGQYEKRIYINSNDEIGQLGHTFNLMAGRLQDTIEDLYDKKNKLVSIITSMDDGVIVVDGNEKIMMTNPAACHIFDVKDPAEGKFLLEVIRNKEIEEIISNQAEEAVEIDVSFPERRKLRIKSTKVLNHDREDEIIGMLIVIQDVSKMRALENMRSDFVANVSHELKTPLTSIKGFAETLKYVDDKETREKFLDIIFVESERLTRLINDILTLSEIENHDFALTMNRMKLNDAVQEVCNIMMPAAEGKNIDFKLNACDDELFMEGDRDKFKQMLINLIDNAIKYSNPDGFVEVSIKKEKDKAIIAVKDNGIGIPEKHLDRLFERFYRVDKARSRSMGGTGLGLAIVKHILIILKGEINVESKVNEGTTFTIYLPLIEKQ